MHRTAALFLLSVFTLSAQSIQYSDARKVWLLTTRQSSYAMGLGADGALRHLYWGAPLWRADDLSAPPPRADLSSFDPRQMLEAEEFPRPASPPFPRPPRALSAGGALQPAPGSPPRAEAYALPSPRGRWAAETQVN